MRPRKGPPAIIGLFSGTLVALLASSLPAGRALADAASGKVGPAAAQPEEAGGGAADEAGYESTVRGRLRLESGSPDDPAAFSTRVRIAHSPPGEQLGDLLRHVPGVRLRDYGPGQLQTFSARAAEAHQVVVVLDGVRLSDPGLGAVDLSLIDPHELSQLEVRRSGGSARFGSGALGGALVLTTSRLRGKRRTSAGLGYGAWRSLSAHASHGDRAGGLRYLASVSYQQSEGDFPFVNDNGQAVRRINNRSRGGGALLKLDHPLGERWQLTLLDRVAAAYRGAPGPSMNPSETAKQHDVRNLAALRLRRYGVLAPAGRASLGLFQRYSRFGFDDAATSGRTRADGFDLGADASLKLPLRPALRLEGRLELHEEWLLDERVGDRNRFSTDVFGSARIDLWGKQLTIVPAARLLLASGFTPAPVPKLGLVLRPLARLGEHPLARLELLANAGRSYRFPSFQELFLRVDGFQPNPELAPEDAWTVDTGLRWRGALVALELAYFQRWLANTILYAPTGSFIVRPNNYSAAFAQGIESALAVTPGLCLAGELTYTATRTRFSELAQPSGGPAIGTLALPGHPRHRLTGRLEWAGWRCRPSARPLLTGLVLRAEVEAQSGMELDRFNSATLREEGRVLLGLAGAYTYRGLTFDVRLRNLLDKRDAVDTLGFPLAPLSVFASTSLDW